MYKTMTSYLPIPQVVTQRYESYLLAKVSYDNTHSIWKDTLGMATPLPIDRVLSLGLDKLAQIAGWYKNMIMFNSQCVGIVGQLGLLASEICDTCYCRINFDIMQVPMHLQCGHYFEEAHVATVERCDLCQVLIDPSAATKDVAAQKWCDTLRVAVAAASGAAKEEGELEGESAEADAQGEEAEEAPQSPGARSADGRKRGA